MNARIVITFLSLIFTVAAVAAQTVEPADSLARELREVVVTARQPATKLVGTTLVTTVPGSNLAGLGTALDVLAQLPMIKVGNDNTVSVIGKSDIEIYIDGRPMRDGHELQQILSSHLKKVELLMAPGAAYESTAGAVLRITTVRDFMPGLSLTDRLNLQKRRRWSVTDYLALAYRKGGMEFFLDGTVNRDNSLIKGTTVNTLVYDGKETTVGATQCNSYPVTAGVVKGGFNYAQGAQSFGAYYRYNPEKGDFVNNGTEWLGTEPPLLRDITRRVRARGHLVSIYYENTFAGKYLLHFDGDFKASRAENATATVYPGAEVPDVSSADTRKSTLWAGKLYTEFPLWGGAFTAGTQDSHTHTTLDYRMPAGQAPDYIPSSVTDARQTSAALYASWKRTFGRLSLSAGLRYEYADYVFRTDGRRDDDVSRSDGLLSPDVSLEYSFSDDAQITLSYKSATVRPPYSHLTGALNYVGRHEIEGGNPMLRDERIRRAQLLGIWKGFVLQAAFTRSLDTYAFVKQIYPARDLQLLMHPVNVDVSALSLYLVWSAPVGCWTPNVTAGMYRQWLEIGAGSYPKPIFSWYFDNTFSLPGGWTVTANMSGSSGGDMHTNRFCSNPFTMDASVGKTLFGKSLTVKLAATDIFNTARNGWTMRTCGVYVDKRQRYDGRGVSLSVIYSFRAAKSRYKGAPAAEAELNRL